MINEEERPFTEVNINYMYPHNPKYDYVARIERINLDEERKEDIITDNGFIISEPQSIKKDVKSVNSIFSSRFGQTLQDINPFADRYKCECGNLTSRIHHGMKCNICGTRVKYVDDNFGYFGWICLKDPYYIIHPNLYKSIQFFIGAKALDNIINIYDEKDENGFSIKTEAPKDQPYYGIGMIRFKRKFNDIMQYYLSKNPEKVDYYNDIIANEDKVFIQSIPVYTTHLRPFRIKDDSFTFEGTNGIYNIICRLVATINKDELKINRKRKAKDQLLYDVQVKYNELYKELESIISGKKGSIRGLIGGRYNFSARSVIIPDQSLRIDQVKLPYKALVELLSQSIMNILSRTYNMTFSEAYKVWYKASIIKDQRVYNIINMMIKDHKNGIYDNLAGDSVDTFDNVSLNNNKNVNLNYGIPILINRNPTIAYGGVLQMYVCDINDNYTMSMPLQVLKLLAADFDGDCLNILYLINKDFINRAEVVFNPRNAMYISRDDGYFNNDVNHQRDTLINANAMLHLSRDKYTQGDIDNIYRLKSMSDKEFDII